VARRRQVVRCPTCLAQLDLQRVRIEDVDGNVSRRSIVRSSFFGTNDRPHSPDEELEALRRRFRYTCERHHTLPRDLMKVPLAPIALLGLSQSMKTHYVAAVGYQLTYQQALAELSRGRSLVFTAVEESRERLNRRYIDPLFVEKAVLAPTEPTRNPEDEPVRDPITFKATFRTSHIIVAGSGERRMYVSLYDAPGEMFRSQHEAVEHAPYALDPAGILLFVDVASMLDVRSELQPAPKDYSLFDPHIISAAGDAVQRWHGTTEPVDVPVAVVVSRADLLLTSPTFERYHKILNEEHAASRRANELAREFVETYARPVPIFVDEAFGGPTQYFFASATGCAPSDDESFPDVTPWGCVDPLLWILEKIGFAS
jgi:hypothetical protein